MAFVRLRRRGSVPADRPRRNLRADLRRNPPGSVGALVRELAPALGCVTAVTLALVAGFAVGAPVARASAAAIGANGATKTFADPIYGFTLQYPAGWQLVAEQDGSHITLLDPATHATVSPIVSAQNAAPAGILAHAAPAEATRVRRRSVGGAAAVDFTLPFTPGPLRDGHGAFRDRAQTRTVVAATARGSGSDVYTLLLTQPTDAAGALSPAVQADDTTFEGIVASFTLPARSSSPSAIRAEAAQPNQAAGMVGGPGACGAVCWADANWNYNKYDDSANGRDCAGVYTSCVYETQAQTAGRYQPDFQCAEFVARALTQSGQVPGLLAGGQQGLGGVAGGSSNGGSYSYGSYPFTYTPYSSNTTYLLVNVGSSTYTGLFHYLANTGLGANIHQNVGGAAAGDVVFFYNGAPSDSTREHVMLVTAVFQDGNSVFSGGWDAYVDGHNVDRYHRLLSDAVTTGGYQIEVIHMHALFNVSGPASLVGKWSSATDGYRQPIWWIYTTGTSLTASAALGDSGNTNACAVAVYVPDGHATAYVGFNVQLAGGGAYHRGVNENNIAGWALLYKLGELPAPPVGVNVGDNNGTTGQQLGVGQMAFLC